MTPAKTRKTVQLVHLPRGRILFGCARQGHIPRPRWGTAFSRAPRVPASVARQILLSSNRCPDAALPREDLPPRRPRSASSCPSTMRCPISTGRSKASSPRPSPTPWLAIAAPTATPATSARTLSCRCNAAATRPAAIATKSEWVAPRCHHNGSGRFGFGIPQIQPEKESTSGSADATAAAIMSRHGTDRFRRTRTAATGASACVRGSGIDGPCASGSIEPDQCRSGASRPLSSA